MRMKQQIILAKIETVAGTDATPAGADAILTSNLKIMPLEGKTVNRNLDRLTYGNDVELHVGVHVAVEFDVEFVGSGTLGTAPGWGKLMKACQCQEAIVAVTSVAYSPNSAGTDTLTLYYFLDGQKHALLGAKGTFQLKLSSQGIPVLHYRFIGLWVDPASVANPTGLTGLNAFQQPRPVTFDDTITVELHSYAAILKSFDFDQGNEVVYFDNPGERSIDIMDRNSKGSISILAPALSAKNYFTTAKANTLGNLKIVHGTVDATKAIFESAGTRVQLLQPKYGDDQGRATLDANLSFVPTSANDDEWTIRLAAA